MTNFIKLSLVILCSICFSQLNAQNIEDKWDQKSNAYVNYKYGFVWHMCSEFNWLKQDMLFQKGAIFAAKDTETNSVAYITVTKCLSKTDNIWNIEKSFTRGQSDGLKKFGDSAHLVESKRCLLGSKNAIKSKSTYSLVGDDRFKDKIELVIVSYSILQNGYVITFSIMVLNEVESELKKFNLTIESYFFSGVILDLKDYLK